MNSMTLDTRETHEVVKKKSQPPKAPYSINLNLWERLVKKRLEHNEHQLEKLPIPALHPLLDHGSSLPAQKKPVVDNAALL